MRKAAILFVSMVGVLFLAGEVKCADNNSCRGFMAADINNDCQVDLEDMQILAENWLGSCNNYSCGDLNEDGTVDMGDFVQLTRQWQDKVSVVINEFMAINSSGLKDEDNDYSDWIELRNYAPYPVNLDGWYLTDSKKDLTKWRIPNITLVPGSFKIIFASTKNRTNPAGELHTNFSLSSSGEYLALVRPDGQTIEFKYSKVPVQYEDVSYGLAIRPGDQLITKNYFTSPTPGAVNSSAASVNLGPVISKVQHTPDRPGVSDPWIITARVRPLQKPVASVTLHYRVMYNGENTIPMYDDGNHNDGIANDEIYGATIPAGVAQPRQMLRYYITATDTNGGTNRLPLGLDNTGKNQSPMYLGTVIKDPSLTSGIPVWEWFTQDTYHSHTRTGARASVCYNGHFYDNIYVRQRGGATNYSSSQKFDFNKGYDLYINEDMPSVGEININGQGMDPSYVRQSLAFETHRKCGTPACESFPILMEVNGSYDRVGILIEQVDEDFLKRNGKDPKGALYKFVQRRAETEATCQEKYWPWLPHTPVFSDTDNPGSIEKKTRKWEDFSDLQQVVDALTSDDPNVINNFVFDNFNLPEMMDYLAARAITNDCDDTRKNFYFYRDTNGTGEWEIYPWDNDYTFGILGDAGQNGTKYMHPFFGDSDYPKIGTNQWNILFDDLFKLPATRQMYLRRLRTMMDKLLQPPGTPTNELKFEARVDQMAAPLYQWLNIASYVNSTKSYFPRRRTDLYVTYGPGGTEPLIPDSINGSTQFTITDTLLSGQPGQTQCHYLVPSDDNLGRTWTEKNFDDSSWSGGPLGIGYERHPGNTVNYTDLIATDINSLMTNSTSVYIRIPFTVSNPADYDALVLYMKYDDGFVAYINGHEVARRFNNDTPPTWNSYASGQRSDSTCRQYEEFILPVSNLNLVPGENILAIQGLNRSTSSSDMLILPELKAGVNVVTNPIVMNIKITGQEHNPASGNQDQEYIKITNNNDVAIDISGWHLRDAVQFTFRPGTVIPSHSNIYVSPNVKAFRNRSISPKGNEGNFVVGPYKGHLSNWGESIKLYSDDYTPIDTLTYVPDPSDAQRYLRITEIMYHPAAPAAGCSYDREDYEYVELKNIGSQDLLLDGVKFSNGISFAFPAGTTIPAGQYRVLVKNQAAFTQRWPDAATKIIGQYTGSLDNKGETITLKDATNSTILDFSYKDSWYAITDGDGFSLTIKDAENTNPNSWSDKSSWRPSAAYNGSPGSDDTGQIPEPGTVVINEVLAHSHETAPDWIELHNTTSQPVNIGGWFLSNSNASNTSRMKYRIADGTEIPANGYIVFYEDQNFGNTNDPGCNEPFALSEGGDSVVLHSGDGTHITGYEQVENFGASESNIAFGRYQKSTGTFNFVAMSVNTPGSANAYPKVGPIVISEIMYHPPSGGSYDREQYEYVELHNITSQPVTLQGDVPWKFTSAIDYQFPDNVTIPADGYIVVVKDIDAFKERYPAVDNSKIYGPYSGKLSNSGEKLELSKPGDKEHGTRYWIRVDRVVYSDGSHPDGSDPWPVSADGDGKSLTRKVMTNYGNDIANWQAADPTPGE